MNLQNELRRLHNLKKRERERAIQRIVSQQTPIAGSGRFNDEQLGRMSAAGKEYYRKQHAGEDARAT